MFWDLTFSNACDARNESIIDICEFVSNSQFFWTFSGITKNPDANTKLSTLWRKKHPHWIIFQRQKFNVFLCFVDNHFVVMFHPYSHAQITRILWPWLCVHPWTSEKWCEPIRRSRTYSMCVCTLFIYWYIQACNLLLLLFLLFDDDDDKVKQEQKKQHNNLLELLFVK